MIRQVDLGNTTPKADETEYFFGTVLVVATCNNTINFTLNHDTHINIQTQRKLSENNIITLKCTSLSDWLDNCKEQDITTRKNKICYPKLAIKCIGS